MKYFHSRLLGAGGSVCPEGVSAGGVSAQGVSDQRGLCPEGCVPRGVSDQKGCLSAWGCLSVWWVSVCLRVSVQGGGCLPDIPPWTE